MARYVILACLLVLVVVVTVNAQGTNRVPVAISGRPGLSALVSGQRGQVMPVYRSPMFMFPGSSGGFGNNLLWLMMLENFGF